MSLILIVLLLGVIVFGIGVVFLLLHFGEASFGPDIVDGEVDQPANADGHGNGYQRDDEEAHVVAVGGLKHIEAEDGEADHVEGQGGFHEDGDVVGVLVVEGLVEVHADHREEGQDQQESDGGNGLVGSNAQAEGDDYPPQVAEGGVHEAHLARCAFEIAK